MKLTSPVFFRNLRNISRRSHFLCRWSPLPLLLLLAQLASAQSTPDSTIVRDSIPSKSETVVIDTSVKPVVHKKKNLPVKKDSLEIPGIDSSNISKNNTSTEIQQAFAQYPVDSIPFKYKSLYKSDEENDFNKIVSFNRYFNFLGEPEKSYEQIRTIYSFDGLFYLMVGVLFYFALVKVLFGKYLSNLFTLFFRASMRQQQIREQVLQSPLPSLTLNILFIIVGGLYGAFIAKHYGTTGGMDFWMMFINFSGLICAIYLIKFLLLKCVGWIFNIQRATDTYIFIVFLTNKMLGILLLPFLIMLSFSGTLLNEVAITVSLILILFFFIYRCIASYAPLRKEIKMNGFHFFLYLCAFEIAPLLLIYRVLLSFLRNA
ncbi:MAG: DUF4271 domain-containing protein [Bacteroidetes bacterium]|nr:DUF4271 domain-containing protein [Bacteroidota bacterium]